MPKKTDFQIILQLNNNYVLTRTLVIIKQTRSKHMGKRIMNKISPLAQIPR